MLPSSQGALFEGSQAAEHALPAFPPLFPELMGPSKLPDSQELMPDTQHLAAHMQQQAAAHHAAQQAMLAHAQHAHHAHAQHVPVDPHYSYNPWMYSAPMAQYAPWPPQQGYPLYAPPPAAPGAAAAAEVGEGGGAAPAAAPPAQERRARKDPQRSGRGRKPAAKPRGAAGAGKRTLQEPTAGVAVRHPTVSKPEHAESRATRRGPM